MAHGSKHGARICFGEYEADLQTGELRKHGCRLRLSGRPMQILALLLERPGELLTRKELREKLWPTDTFVDFEHGVNTAVRTLRQALCDSHKEPRFIETLPRRGYRFIGEIARVAGVEKPAETPSVSAAAKSTAQAHTPSSLAGQIGKVVDPDGRPFVLLPVDALALEEMEACEAANDELGIPFLLAGGQVLMVACGTMVRILEARQPERGCRVRILEGEFYGQKAFAPRKHLEVHKSAASGQR